MLVFINIPTKKIYCGWSTINLIGAVTITIDPAFLPLEQPLSGSVVEGQEPVHVTSRPISIIFFGRMIVGTNNVDEIVVYKSLNLWTPMVCLWLYRSLQINGRSQPFSIRQTRK